MFATGEAVALELPIARLPTRALAFLVDFVLQVILLFGGIVVAESAVAQLGSDDALVAAVSLVTVVAVLVGYPVAWEALTRGRTPGKMVVGLRVVREDGGPIDFRHALTRGLCGAIVDFWMLGFFGLVAVVAATYSSRGRRVGDLLAGTVVIRADLSLLAPSLVLPPLRLAPWASRLDLTRITDEFAYAMRQYLTRFRELAPDAQARLGSALAVQVGARLGTPLPAGVSTVEVLAAVLAERQRRSLDALTPTRFTSSRFV